MISGEHCAVAVAVKDIFKNAYVSSDYIQSENIRMKLPEAATNFINDFDASTPSERLNLTPFTFSISIPDALIDRINIDEVTELLNNHPTLKLV